MRWPWHLDPEGLGIFGWICKKVFKGKEVKKVTTIKRTVVLPKRDPTPDGFQYVESELIGEQAAFTYRNIRTGDTMTVFQKATVVGTGSCILFTVTQFAWECTPFSDAMECGKVLGQDPDALRDWGLVEDIEAAGECDPAPFLGGDVNFG